MNSVLSNKANAWALMEDKESERVAMTDEDPPASPKIRIDESRCKGCGLCTLACRQGLIRLSEKINRLGFSPAEISPAALHDCTSCALCARMCPDVAISVFRREDGKYEK